MSSLARTEHGVGAARGAKQRGAGGTELRHKGRRRCELGRRSGAGRPGATSSEEQAQRAPSALRPRGGRGGAGRCDGTEHSELPFTLCGGRGRGGDEPTRRPGQGRRDTAGTASSLSLRRAWGRAARGGRAVGGGPRPSPPASSGEQNSTSASAQELARRCSRAHA
ncbi:hypothetical protein GQ55_9G356400 [Panicum hallii var. hallii]|uniref:Uncharacterized protein n=1 Tax=Panicum hallii var. hallii TaxID=1504633 RepID=A0A2T7C8Q0_9POAL|nr:hypothetical protein GQ55_9G356400 [Panicum hallii var. hallii]